MLLPRLTRLGLLSGKVKASLAVTGGVHPALDAVRVGFERAQYLQVLQSWRHR